MKLLPQTEVKAMKKQSLDDSQILKTKLTHEINDLTNRLSSLRMELNEFQGKVKDEKIVIQQQYDVEKTRLLSELSSLQEQVRTALEPIETEKKQVALREQLVRDTERKQQKEWTALYQKTSHLQSIEDQLRSAEKQYFIKTDENREWEKRLTNREAELVKQEQGFNARLREAYDDYEKKFATVNTAIVQTKMREAEYENLKSELEKERLKLVDERKHLESQRHSIQRTYEAIKQKEEKLLNRYARRSFKT